MYLPVIQDNIMKEIFVKGFKPGIQAEMFRENCVDPRDIIDMTINVEKRLNTLWQAWNSANRKKNIMPN